MEDGGDFLGQHVRKSKGKLRRRPATKHGKACLAERREVIKGTTHAPADARRTLRNPTRRGGANLHRHAASQATVVKVDTALCTTRWPWARRRHPTKSRSWSKEKYCGPHGNQHGRFFGTRKPDQGKTEKTRLALASATPRKRHVTIQGHCNPSDPTWANSRVERLRVKREHTLQGKRTRRHLWREQQGLCPVCSQRIHTRTGWHPPPITYKAEGGTDQAENRLLVHPNGQTPIHAKGLPVPKPCPSRGKR